MFSKTVKIERLTNNNTLNKNAILFCFPYAGGSAYAYNGLAKYAPSNLEVCSVQLPGRGPLYSVKPFETMVDAVRPIVSSIVGKVDKPFVFFGHSMGGILCFETALLLKKMYNISPRMIVISGRGHPSLSSKTCLHKMSDRDLVKELKERNGTPDEVLNNEEMLELILPVIRADYKMCETYAYNAQDTLDCSIAVYGGLEDNIKEKDLLAWKSYTKGEFVLRMFTGGHFFINTSEQQVANILYKEFSGVIT
jgi:medium-chain acyl-[acyl-carrier-protein] hydrolase